MTPKQYQLAIRRCRRDQLRSLQEYSNVIGIFYDQAFVDISVDLSEIPRDDSDEERRDEALRKIAWRLARLKLDLFLVTDNGMLYLAQLALIRETTVEVMAGVVTDPRFTANHSVTRGYSNGKTVTIDFSQMARSAANATADHVYADGLKLADRLAQLSDETGKTVSQLVVDAIMNGHTEDELAKKLKDLFTANNVDNPKYRALRIARTELNNAHRRAQYLALINEDGTVKDYVKGVAWRLSPAHSIPCFCDILASQDVDGLGPGNYDVLNAPESPHPMCLCSTITILVGQEDTDLPGSTPQPEMVPERIRRAQ